MPLFPQPPLLLGCAPHQDSGKRSRQVVTVSLSHLHTLTVPVPPPRESRGSRGWPSLSSREPCEILTHASLFPDILRELCSKLTIIVSPALFHGRGNRARKAEGSGQRPHRSEGWCHDTDPSLTNVKFEVSSFKPKMEVERDSVFSD